MHSSSPPDIHLLLQGTLDSLISHVALLDENGVILAVNAAWRQFADQNGLVNEKAGVGTNYLAICGQGVDDDSQRAFEGIRAILNGHSASFSLEYPCHSKTEQRWFALNATRFAGEGQTRVVVAHDNITARKMTEIRLREETELTETLYRVGQVVAAELDLRKIVQTLTEAATELCGAQCGAFVPNNPDEREVAFLACRLHNDEPASSDWTGAVAPLSAAFRDTGVVRSDDLPRDPRYNSREPFWTVPLDNLKVVSYLAAPVVSRSGEVLGGLFLGHDKKGAFTAKHESAVSSLASQAAVAMDNARLYAHARRESALAAASERRYRFATESIPQMVWTTDHRGYHEYFNRQWCDYTGLDEKTSLGEGWAIPLHPDDRQRSRERWQKSLESGETYEIEYRFRRHDGVYRWFLGRALSQRDEKGRILKWFGTCTDIHGLDKFAFDPGTRRRHAPPSLRNHRTQCRCPGTDHQRLAGCFAHHHGQITPDRAPAGLGRGGRSSD